MAKRILPMKMWFITRRVMWREMRLKPSRKLNKIFNYIVFKVAQTHKVRICTMCVMSNHWHAVVGAEERNLPAFLQAVHSELARAINAAHGDFGAVWDKDDQNYELLEDDDAVLAAISYTMNNPVTPGGVRFARNWPGVRVAWSAKKRVKKRAKERTFKRARPFYRTKDEGGNTPATVTRRLYRPFGFEGISDEELTRRIEERCHEGQERAATEVFDAGKSFRKRSEVLRLSRYSRATSNERHFEVRRRIKGASRKARIARDKLWDAEYDAILTRWLAGERSVIFPYGTYKMVVLHGANMAAPPP